MKRVLSVLVACSVLSSCVSYAGIAVAPNGAIWIVRNSQGFGGAPTVEGVFVCVPRGADLSCSRVNVRGAD